MKKIVMLLETSFLAVENRISDIRKIYELVTIYELGVRYV